MNKNLKDMSLQALEGYFEGIGEKKYRAGQVFSWIYKGVDSFDEMTDLSFELRARLCESADISALVILERLTSKADGTRKYLFGLPDGNIIESVFMKYKFGNSICVSSQAGCRMGCIFCASGKNGLARDLSAGEMADQILKVQKDISDKINHVVVMGIGEPFDNYENLAEFIRIINDKRGLNIGMRNITVSTCGLIPQIKAFSNDFPKVNLAVSLHAPNGATRAELMPTAKKYGYPDLLQVCREHTIKTGRRITFEYVLINGKNDDKKSADELAENLKGMLCHVNLIPMNVIGAAKSVPCGEDKAEQFMRRLSQKGIPVTLRRETGSDIAAACGQLRLTKMLS